MRREPPGNVARGPVPRDGSVKITLEVRSAGACPPRFFRVYQAGEGQALALRERQVVALKR